MITSINTHPNINLCIVADDFGMHKAVNDGILQAFTEGILTDTNLMPPAPAFLEAVQMTKQYSVPVGLHATFTCEWDHLRWGPISGGSSFLGQDAFFKKSVIESWEFANITETEIELNLQFEILGQLGIPLTHISEHNDFDRRGILESCMSSLIAKSRIPYKNQVLRKNMPLRFNWDTVFSTSGPSIDFDEAKIALLERLRKLTAGYHMWVAHPATDSKTLDDIASPTNRSFNWARVYRAIDLKLLLDKDIRTAIEELNINLISIANCPVITKA